MAEKTVHLAVDPSIEPTAWLIRQACERKWPGQSPRDQARQLVEVLPRGNRFTRHRVEGWLKGAIDPADMRVRDWLVVCRTLGIRRQLFAAQARDLDEVGQVLPNTGAIRRFCFATMPIVADTVELRRWWKHELLPALIACGAVNERRSPKANRYEPGERPRMRFFSTTERVLGALRIVLEPDATPPELRERWRRYRIEVVSLEERKWSSDRRIDWWGPEGLTRIATLREALGARDNLTPAKIEGRRIARHHNMETDAVAPIWKDAPPAAVPDKSPPPPEE